MKHNALIPELAVAELSLSLRFYKSLGFVVEYERPEEGFAFLSFGHAQLMLDQIGKGRTWRTGKLARPLGRGLNIQIHVRSLAPLLRRLKQRRIALFLGPEDRWYRINHREAGNRQFLVQDPDGYLLRFFEDLGAR